MKKIVQTCVILCFCMNISAQINLEQEFKEFIVNFDMCQYPFYVAWGENEENSECETEHGGGISKEHYQWFVKEQGLKPFAWGCDMDQFLNYVALLQLPPTDSSYLLIFGLNLEEVSCGDGLLLASYSKKTFQLQDTLTIYSYGSMNAQYIDGKQILQNVIISCYLSEHSFQIHRKEGFYFNKDNGDKKLKTGKILTTYTITDGGKFIKKDEDIDEKIFDEIGRKIVFPKLPFTGRR